MYTSQLQRKLKVKTYSKFVWQLLGMAVVPFILLLVLLIVLFT